VKHGLDKRDWSSGRPPTSTAGSPSTPPPRRSWPATAGASRGGRCRRPPRISSMS
jgi:hypothetical protein